MRGFATRFWTILEAAGETGTAIAFEISYTKSLATLPALNPITRLL
jgi:hypothetical protein